MCIKKIMRVQMVLMLAGMAWLSADLAEAVEFEFSGQLRPRFESIDQGTLGAKQGEAKTYTTMRTRVGIKAIIDSDTSAFVQIQDVRTFGGETPTPAPPSITRTGTNTSASGLDVHQAYMNLNNLLDSNVSLKLGRQEIIFDEHRLFGNINWIQQGQSHDAVRLGWMWGDLDFTAFGAQTIANDTHPTLSAQLSTAAASSESYFAGLRATYRMGEGGDRITPYYYYSNDPANTFPVLSGGSAVNLYDNLHTAGLYYLKHIGDVRLRFDGAYQFGKFGIGPGKQDVRAFMLTAAAGVPLKLAKGANATLWYDYLSGSKDISTGAYKTFNTMYATNHKFYGFMDKFLNTPETGLQDIAVKLWLKPTDKLKLNLDFHQFLRAVTTAARPNKNIGQEIDFTFTYPLARNTRLLGGYSHYFGSGAVNGGLGGDTTLNGNWLWLMVDMVF